MVEKFPEATNLQYIKHEDIAELKKVFVNNNSYRGSAVIQKILSYNHLQKTTDDENVIYEVYGTNKQNEKECHEISDVIILNCNDDSFLDSVLACDIIIYDISQEWSEARRFLKHFEEELENLRVDKKKQIILISTIMTWAQTQQTDVAITDLNYKLRKPQPCFINHLILERDVINLSKKFKDLVSSVVVCPGIIYGETQDILHFLYKKCYFNNVQIDIFAPGTNFLPSIYIEDFKNIMMLLIRQFPDKSFPYILAVQPEPLQAKNLISTLAEAAGGSGTRVKVCSREEIFLMDEELMTVRQTLIKRLSVLSD
jgi:nucleoside-diphosphate-sugar epimerase